MHVKYSLLTIIVVGSAMSAIASDRQVVGGSSVASKTAPAAQKSSSSTVAANRNVINAGPDVLIGVCDLYQAMSITEDGKEKQQAMEALQKELTNHLEQQRQTSAKKLETFNAKKDTLSKEAREKEEQELLALSRDLQNEVQKAQERIRQELNKVTEELARSAEQAAIQIAKADKLDLLIEKNTGRVIYSKESYDVTARIETRMNEERTIRLAQNKKQQSTITASASTDTKKAATGVVRT